MFSRLTAKSLKPGNTIKQNFEHFGTKKRPFSYENERFLELLTRFELVTSSLPRITPVFIVL